MSSPYFSSKKIRITTQLREPSNHVAADFTIDSWVETVAFLTDLKKPRIMYQDFNTLKQSIIISTLKIKKFKVSETVTEITDSPIFAKNKLTKFSLPIHSKTSFYPVLSHTLTKKTGQINLLPVSAPPLTLKPEHQQSIYLDHVRSSKNLNFLLLPLLLPLHFLLEKFQPHHRIATSTDRSVSTTMLSKDLSTLDELEIHEHSLSDIEEHSSKNTDRAYSTFNTAEFSSIEASAIESSELEFSGVESSTIEFSTPEFAAAEFSGPEFSSPEFSSPEFSSPEFSSPEFSSPEFAAVEFSAPEFSSPEFSAPEFATVEFSSPEFSAPEFAAVEFSSPEFSAPEFAVVELSSPDFKSPEFSSPDEIFHDVQSTASPSLFETPATSFDSTGFEAPQFSMADSDKSFEAPSPFSLDEKTGDMHPPDFNAPGFTSPDFSFHEETIPTAYFDGGSGNTSSSGFEGYAESSKSSFLDTAFGPPKGPGGGSSFEAEPYHSGYGEISGFSIPEFKAPEFFAPEFEGSDDVSSDFKSPDFSDHSEPSFFKSLTSRFIDNLFGSKEFGSREHFDYESSHPESRDTEQKYSGDLFENLFSNRAIHSSHSNFRESSFSHAEYRESSFANAEFKESSFSFPEFRDSHNHLDHKD